LRPWSEPEVPTATKYPSAPTLARDLNEHGLGCDDATQSRVFRAFEEILTDRGLLSPDIGACSVDGRPVLFSVYPPGSLEGWLGSEPTPRSTNLQDAVAQTGRE
jgi:hypothetical protein